MPETIAGRLNDELKRVLSSAEIKDRLAQEGMVPAHLSRGDFRAFLESEVAQWGKVVKATGIKLE